MWSQKWKHFILTEAEVGREGATAYAYPGAPGRAASWRRARRWPCWNRSASAWRGSCLGHLI